MRICADCVHCNPTELETGFDWVCSAPTLGIHPVSGRLKKELCGGKNYNGDCKDFSSKKLNSSLGEYNWDPRWVSDYEESTSS